MSSRRGFAAVDRPALCSQMKAHVRSDKAVAGSLLLPHTRLLSAPDRTAIDLHAIAASRAAMTVGNA